MIQVMTGIINYTMSIKFEEQNHKYTSTDDSNISWVSVTSLISKFKQPFDASKIAQKCSVNKKSKWYGLSPEEIQKIWKTEANEAADLGHWYHLQREKDITEFTTIQRRGIDIPVIKPIIIDGIKHAPSQKLSEGVYPEHMVYLKSAGICGQSDRVEVVDSIVDIIDYKTNKELKLQAFTNWEGVTQKMTGPLSHLDDCDIVHYGLQLSIYMYIILKHNPKFRPGRLCIDHITFEEEDRTQYNARVLKKDESGNPIIKEVQRHEVPYYKDEVISLIHYLRA